MSQKNSEKRLFAVTISLILMLSIAIYFAASIHASAVSDSGQIATLSALSSSQTSKITSLEGQVSNLNSEIVKINGAESTFQKEAASAQNNISTYKNEVNTLDKELNNITSAYDNLNTAFGSLQAGVNALLSKVATKNGVIADLDSKVNDLSLNINFTEAPKLIVLNSKLPAVFNTSDPGFSNYSMLDGAAYGDSQFLLVGGKSFSPSPTNFTTYLAGLYNPVVSKTVIPLNTSGLGRGWFTSAAWNGTDFLITGMELSKSSTGFSPLLFLFSPKTNTFMLLDNLSNYNWIISSVAWNGSAFVVVGNSETSDYSVPEMGVYSAKTGFINMSSVLSGYNMSKNQNGPIFNSISWTGSNYIVMADLANFTVISNTGEAGNLTFLMYSPSLSYEGNYTSNSVNWYTNAGAVWDGSQLVVANSHQGGYYIGLFNPAINSYITVDNVSDGVPGIPAFNGSSVLIPGLYNVASPMMSMFS